MPPKAVSLNGELALGFGSRGHGWASAHYEPGKVVINLTKTSRDACANLAIAAPIGRVFKDAVLCAKSA